MKRILSLLLSLCLLTGLLAGCAADGPKESSGETRTFIDSLGRNVEIPVDITRIAPSGAVASMIMSALAPEHMVCIGNAVTEEQLEYLPAELGALPVTGQLYGSKSTLNLEQLLACDPQVILDMGDVKGDMAADLDALQEQVGLPVIFVEADLDSMAEAYRTLGTLLQGKTERGHALGDFVAKTVEMAAESSAKVTDQERLSVLYTTGADGLAANAKGSIQCAVLELVGADNAVVVEEVSNKSGGSIIGMEQLYNFDPDVILFAADSLYDLAADDPAWSQLRAIQNGAYAQIPSLPYNWLSNPPSFNMVIGVWWLGNLLYPQYFDYDMGDTLQEIFSLFWNRELTEEEAAAFLESAVWKGAS